MHLVNRNSFKEQEVCIFVPLLSNKAKAISSYQYKLLSSKLRRGIMIPLLTRKFAWCWIMFGYPWHYTLHKGGRDELDGTSCHPPLLFIQNYFWATRITRATCLYYAVPLFKTHRVHYFLGQVWESFLTLSMYYVCT